MRAFSWVPLLGLLAALAAAQDGGRPSTKSTVIHLVASPHQSMQSRAALQSRLEALEDLANSKMSVVTPSSPQQPVHEEPPAHKTSGGSILDTVQGIMASFSPTPASPPAPSETNDNQGGEKLVAQPAAAEEGDAAGEEAPPPTTTAAAEESTTSVGSRQEEPSPVNNNNNNNKNNNKNKQGKLVRRYNEVTDNVLRLLSRSLSQLEPLPITINDDVALMALEASEPEPEPEPSKPEGEGEGGAQSGGNKKKKKKNKKNKKRNKNKNEDSDVEEPERNTNKRNKKNKTKAAGNQEEEQEEEAVQGRPSKNRNKNKKNKNKRNKNKRKNNRKNRRNKKNKSGMENPRDGRAMFEDDDGEDESPDFSGRRNPAPARKNKKNTKGNKKGKRKNKNRKNKKNKNKKNRKNQQEGKVESRDDSGPVYPSVEERELSNAYITGLTSLSRDGDVVVDASANAVLVDVKVQVGPLFVQLADSARALTKSQVSTTLEANMQFRIKNKGRGRQLIKLTDLNMGGPEEVNVARLDLPLEPELVSAAQDEVREALDVPRLGRIFRRQLEAIFEEDNVVQNLEHHELLKKE